MHSTDSDPLDFVTKKLQLRSTFYKRDRQASALAGHRFKISRSLHFRTRLQEGLQQLAWLLR